MGENKFLEKVFIKDDSGKINFKCQRCGKCCRNSRIRISPYDILRICRRLNISTSEFHKKYSYFILDNENDNLLTCMLKTEPKCCFLGENGCEIYKDRPFGCRIYPLATQPFFDGKKLTINFYLLEKCLGICPDKKISLREYKKQQCLDSSECYNPWVEFKVVAINKNLPKENGYYLKFFKICYDFDSLVFKECIKQLNLVWPEDIRGRYNTIIKTANKFLLEPFESKIAGAVK